MKAKAMKVLIFNSYYYPHIFGGAEKSVQILAESFPKENIIPVVLTTSNRDREERLNGVKVYYVKTPNLYWAFESKKVPKALRLIWHWLDAYNYFAKRKVRQILKREEPDIVNTNTLLGFSVVVWRAAKELGIPVVHILRDYYLPCWRSSMFKENRNCTRSCFDCGLLSGSKKKYSHNIDAVIGVSRNILQRHLDLGFFKNVKIRKRIQNPVERSSIPRQGVLKQEREKSEVVFGFVGRLSASKGIEFILKNFNDHVRQAKLYVYGRAAEQRYEDYLKTTYASDQILFKGFKNHHEIYSEVDVLLIASTWQEPFARAIIEACAYGVPVIASEVGGIPEIIMDKMTGLLFKPNDERSFLEKIDCFIKNPREIDRMSRKCLEVSQKLSPGKIAKEYVKTYREILRQND